MKQKNKTDAVVIAVAVGVTALIYVIMIVRGLPCPIKYVSGISCAGVYVSSTLGRSAFVACRAGGCAFYEEKHVIQRSAMVGSRAVYCRVDHTNDRSLVRYSYV